MSLSFRLDMNYEEADSDDDEPYQGEPMFEVKDPYVMRSLPALIGSDIFNQTENVGLIDAPTGKCVATSTKTTSQISRKGAICQQYIVSCVPLVLKFVLVY